VKKCFIICPIGNENSEMRKHSDQLLKYIISPVIKNFGYTLPNRADLFDEPGLITQQIIQHLFNSDLVIADLTAHNPNVYYELAFRHTIKKPVILMHKKNDKLPFDIKDNRTIFFDLHDLDNVELVKEQLSKEVKAIEANQGEFFNPISISFDIEKLRTSKNPIGHTIAELFNEVRDLKNMVQKNTNSIEKIKEQLANLYDPNFAFNNTKKLYLSEEEQRMIKEITEEQYRLDKNKK
jgi:hypothetical protein